MRLDGIASHVPDARLEVGDVIRSAGGTADECRVFTALFAMQRVAISEPGAGIDRPLLALLDRLSPDPVAEGAQVLIHAHSLPIAPDRQPKLGALRAHPVLSRLTAIWDMDQFNCAGMFHALEAARRLLASGVIGEVFLFAGDDLADWPLAARYVPSCTVLGDGFALLRLSAGAGGVRIGPVRTRHFAGFEGGIDGGDAEIDRYNRAHLAIIGDTLAEAGHIPGDAAIFPHNINGLAWRLYCRKTGQDPKAVHAGLVAETGHCCNADPFITLDRALSGGAVSGTLISVGMAGFAGAARVSGRMAA